MLIRYATAFMLALLGSGCCAAAGFAICATAYAGDPGKWLKEPADIQLWFAEPRQPPSGKASCCGDADAFEAENTGDEPDGIHFRIPDGRGIIADGFEGVAPHDRIQSHYGNPTGRIIVFLATGTGIVFCYIPLPGL